MAYAIIARYTPNMEAFCGVMDRRGVMYADPFTGSV
jgi:hypothetical protein